MPLPTKRGLPAAELNACKAIVRNLFSSEHTADAWVFYEPLDAEVLALDDYHYVVDQPMDLTTIKERLNFNFYSTVAEFAYDVRLMFYNAYIYTKPGHLIYDMAKKLQAVFEELYKKIPKPKGDAKSCADSCSEVDVEMQSTSTASSPQFQDNSDPMVVETACGQSDKANEANLVDINETPLSREEELDLHFIIQQLEGVKLLNVIHMIHQLEGLSFTFPIKEFEFDMLQLKTTTKRSLMAFLVSNGVTGKRASRAKKNYK